VLLVFTAKSEDYTARGKIITPLKAHRRRNSHALSASIEESMTITAQEAWVARDSGKKIEVPQYLRQSSRNAFQARERQAGRRSGVQPAVSPITTMEGFVSSAEHRAARTGEIPSSPTSPMSMRAPFLSPGKMELNTRRTQRPGTIARELIRTGVGRRLQQNISPTLTSNPSSNGSNWVGETKCRARTQMTVFSSSQKSKASWSTSATSASRIAKTPAPQQQLPK